MRSVIRLLVTFSSVATVSALVACTVESPTYVTTQYADGDGGATTTDSTSSAGTGTGTSSGATDGGGSTSTCSQSDYTKPDLTKLTACGNGLGHCFDKTKVDLAGAFVACSDASQVCVPDEVLNADGTKLKSCTSIIGAGGCIAASLLPQIAAQGGSALKQDVCSASELCVPCTDPTHNNAPTGMCAPIGAHENACTAATTGGATDAGSAPLAKCCTTLKTSNGVCLPESAVPPAQQKQTKQDVCATGDVCLPKSFVENKPIECTAGLFGAGVCMDTCFSDGMGFAKNLGVLSSKGCGSTEVCVPCSFVKGQGVPSCE